MIDTWPNRLTLLRLIIVPIMIAVFSAIDGPLRFYLLFLLFLVGTTTDYLDGILARKLNQCSAIGRSFDPIADKLLVLTTILILLTADFAPFLPCALIICREIFVSGLRESILEHDNKIVLHVTTLAKYKTTTQMLAIIALLGHAAFPQIDYVEEIGLALIWLAAILSVITGFDYTQKGIKSLS